MGLTVFSVPANYGEAFGLYVIEALAAGVPVVQPSTAAFPAILAATGGGVLCESDDAKSLPNALEELLQNPERARALGEDGSRSRKPNLLANLALLRSALLALLAEYHPAEPLPQLREQFHSRPDRCLNLLNS